MGDADSFVGNYEFQVPIFVLTHPPPRVAPKQDEPLTFTFVTDGVESAVAQAKAADIRSLSVRMELPRWRLSRAGLSFATGNSPNYLRRISSRASTQHAFAQGDPADVVVVDRDPLTCTPEQLRTMPVAATLRGGTWTYSNVG